MIAATAAMAGNAAMQNNAFDVGRTIESLMADHRDSIRRPQTGVRSNPAAGRARKAASRKARGIKGRGVMLTPALRKKKTMANGRFRGNTRRSGKRSRSSSSSRRASSQRRRVKAFTWRRNVMRKVAMPKFREPKNQTRRQRVLRNIRHIHLDPPDVSNDTANDIKIAPFNLKDTFQEVDTVLQVADMASGYTEMFLEGPVFASYRIKKVKITVRCRTLGDTASVNSQGIFYGYFDSSVNSDKEPGTTSDIKLINLQTGKGLNHRECRFLKKRHLTGFDHVGNSSKTLSWTITPASVTGTSERRFRQNKYMWADAGTTPTAMRPMGNRAKVQVNPTLATQVNQMDQDIEQALKVFVTRFHVGLIPSFLNTSSKPGSTNVLVAEVPPAPECILEITVDRLVEAIATSHDWVVDDRVLAHYVAPPITDPEIYLENEVNESA